MLMDHPPPIIACGRENAPQGCFEGLTPVQVPMVVEELVACDSKVQEALADTLEVIQEMAQAGPVTVDGRITPSTSASEPRVRAFHARGSSAICPLSSAPCWLHIPPGGLVICG